MSNKEIKIHPEITASPEMKDIDNEPAWDFEGLEELEYLIGFDKPIFKGKRDTEQEQEQGRNKR